MTGALAWSIDEKLSLGAQHDEPIDDSVMSRSSSHDYEIRTLRRVSSPCCLLAHALHVQRLPQNHHWVGEETGGQKELEALLVVLILLT
jgi:hypothetical protein